jgi:hypothetical protein
MVLSFIIQVLGWLTCFSLFIAFLFSVLATKNFFIHKYKEEIIRTKRFVFLFLAFGIGFLTVAFSVSNLYNFFGLDIFPSLADFFFFFAYSFFLAAFAFLWFRIKKLHKLHKSDVLFCFNVGFAILIWLYYLSTHVIAQSVSGLSGIAKFLVFFYPLVVSLIFFLTLIIHPLLKAGIVSTPLWYMSSGIFLYFVGFMISFYYYWSPSLDFIPLIYSVLFLFSSFYFVLGAFVARRRFSHRYRKTPHHIVKKLTRSV